MPSRPLSEGKEAPPVDAMMLEQNPEQEAASSDKPWPHRARLITPKSKKKQINKTCHDEVQLSQIKKKQKTKNKKTSPVLSKQFKVSCTYYR